MRMFKYSGKIFNIFIPAIFFHLAMLSLFLNMRSVFQIIFKHGLLIVNFGRCSLFILGTIELRNCLMRSASVYTVAKPLVVDGTSKSHELSLAYDEASLSMLDPPLVLQEFVNHGKFCSPPVTVVLLHILRLFPPTVEVRT